MINNASNPSVRWPDRPCGDEAPCFVGFAGKTLHDPNWHRVQELEATLRKMAGEHDGHDSECIRCQARLALDHEPTS